MRDCSHSPAYSDAPRPARASPQQAPPCASALSPHTAHRLSGPGRDYPPRPLCALLRLVAHTRPPRLREPRLHAPRERLLARLALPPHRDACVCLLRHGFFDHAVDVCKACFATTRAARLDQRRVRVEAYDALWIVPVRAEAKQPVLECPFVVRGRLVRVSRHSVPIRVELVRLRTRMCALHCWPRRVFFFLCDGERKKCPPRRQLDVNRAAPNATAGGAERGRTRNAISASSCPSYRQSRRPDPGRIRAFAQSAPANAS
jgi:hypothetical protein